jgi:hypothetical protein
VGLKLNGTHQLLAYADDMNLLGGNIDTINKSTETLIGASKEVGLKVNIEKTKYMMKNGVFWGVTPCGSCKNRRFGGTWRLLHQGDKNR